jgi:hypothetical protein
MCVRSGANISLIQKGNAAQGLKMVHKRYTEESEQKIISTSFLLAQQNYDWVESRLIQNPELYTLWESAVQREITWVGRYIVDGIKDRLRGLPLQPTIPEPKVLVLNHKALLSICPLVPCRKGPIELLTIRPEDFNPSFLDDVRRGAPFNRCDHRIPNNGHALRIIQAYRELTNLHR